MTDESIGRVGQQIGNYCLVQLLGQGAFADVYLGEHTLTKVQMAIKLIRVRPTRPLKYFLREAKMVTRLRHPHIVRVFEGNVEDGIPYLVMDYLPGGTLRERHPRGTQLPPKQVALYIEQVADALSYVHQQKLIHRDVKPENFLVDADEQILLSDFGLALIVQSFSSQTGERLAGTGPYMAPEQIQSRPCYASDQYALGIVAYEWLTGEQPFKGPLVQIAIQHMFDSPPPLREKVPALPKEVEQVVLKALAKEPSQRFATVKAFARALEASCQSSQNYTLFSSDDTLLPDQSLRSKYALPVESEPSYSTDVMDLISPSTLPPRSQTPTSSDEESTLIMKPRAQSSQPATDLSNPSTLVPRSYTPTDVDRQPTWILKPSVQPTQPTLIIKPSVQPTQPTLIRKSLGQSSQSGYNSPEERPHGIPRRSVLVGLVGVAALGFVSTTAALLAYASPSPISPPTSTPTSTPDPTPTSTPTPADTPSPTQESTPTSTQEPTPTPRSTRTPAPTSTPAPTPTPTTIPTTPTSISISTPTSASNLAPSPSPTALPAQ
jgi:serine/threonine protein kinase